LQQRRITLIEGRSGSFYANLARVYVYENNFRPLTADMRRRVMIHEFGHVMGLGHPTGSSASIMHGTPGTIATNIMDFDRTSLNRFYGN